MSRSTQFIGHTEEVERFIDFLLEQKKASVTLKNIPVTGMFEEKVHDLRVFTLPNGEEWEECVQSEIWSSGPVIALCIVNRLSNLAMGWEMNDEIAALSDKVVRVRFTGTGLKLDA